MAGITITTQKDLPSPDGDETYGFLRINVLSPRPGLKMYTALRFRQEIKRHPDEVRPGEAVVMVFLKTLVLDLPQTLV